MDNILLMTAINNYPMPGADLNGCINDQDDIIKMLEKFNIKIDINNYRDEECTKAKLMKELKYFARTMTSGSFTHHQSSHGTYDKDPYGRESDGLREGMLMVDGQVFFDYEYVEIINSFNPNVDVTCMLDLCFSGGMARFAALNVPMKPRFFQINDTTGKPKKRDTQKQIRASLFSACSEDQTAADAFVDGRYNGIWSKRFTQSFKPGQKKEETFKKIRTYLPKNGFDQIPLLLGSGNKEIGLFGQQAVAKKCWLIELFK